MADQPKQPIIVLLTSHWVTMAGVALVTLAGFSWLFVLPTSVRGNVGNPYIGLLVFIAIPAVFFAGLILIPIGIALGRRKAASGLGEAADRKAAWRRAGMFFAIMTLANVVIGSQLTYRAVEHMETVQFCGQSCHVMKPEFTAHLLQPHQAVACVECHVTPGASGWVQSKINGTRQLMGVAFNSYPRPIESAMESNRLVPSADTCEGCHAREKFIGPRLYIHTEFKDDEPNTRMETVLMMRVGGGSLGGIHGAHMGPGVRIRYRAADKKRQTIPWVEYTDSANVTRTYLASGTKAEAVSSLPTFEMQCVDCHNRAAHSFDLPERAVDRAIGRGQLPADLPFLKKTSIELLKAPYASQDEAAQKIPAALDSFYQQKYGDVWAKRSNDVQLAAQALVGIYQSNVFPDLKVTWGTYPNNLGHMDDPGCFRCHDDSHASSDKKTIPQDCSTCHEMLATEETSPAILKTLGLSDTGANALKQ
jgi:NapC/NirT cytochrome c family, N-terminal region